METKLGKIRIARFGLGGYQDAMIGITFDLSGESWGVGDFWGAWAIERNQNAKWTEQDRVNQLGNMVMRVNKLLGDAKVQSVEKLVGVPVEVTFDNSTLKSWRILTEVL